MISLNDYLYSGDTVLKILQKYEKDLRDETKKTHNQIDTLHCNFLMQITELLEHNDFLTYQSKRIRDFYKYMADKYPFLAFTFKGRIKSLIRAEEKFNGYVVEYIYDYYKEHNKFPSEADIKNNVNFFRDLIAYRIVISMPRCHLKDESEREEVELKYLYEIANELPGFLEERGFTVETSGVNWAEESPLLDDSVRPYYRDYVANPKASGYRSLHITFYDNSARCYIELQLRTKSMDDLAEIGVANHGGYEKIQEEERTRRNQIPDGECQIFDEACKRVESLQTLELSEVDVNMFAALNNQLINDGCGLFRGRLIRPYEHLSRFQNDIVD